jgi:predicted PurR-regulated permease PerM
MVPERRVGERALVTGSALVIVIAGLKIAAPIIVPVLVAVFLAVLSLPPMRYLQSRGVPEGLATMGVFGGVVIGVVLVSMFIGNSVREFSGNLPLYEAHLQESIGGVLEWLHGLGLDVSLAHMRESFDSGSLMTVMRNVAKAMSSMLSNTAFVVFTVAFMLAEANAFPRKLRAAWPGSNTRSYSGVIGDIQTYLGIKTQVSAATGLVIATGVWIIGVDYPLLWGMVAFLLNFIPTLGSIVAAVPAVLLAFVQFGWERALVTMLLYVIVNVGVGNVLEPRLMGRRLGLSPLVVFLSLVFWGWVWGPLGMLLSVPLTMVVKLLLEGSDDLRWAAVLLGSGSELPDDDADERLARAPAEEPREP